MRILLLSHGAGPYGAERMLVALAERLTLCGHEVVLSLPHAGPAVDLARAAREVDVRIDTRRRLPRDVREGLAFFLGGAADMLSVRRLVREIAPDVTWINSMYNPWAALGARLGGAPTVWHLHERSMGGLAGLLLSAVIGLAADRVVTVSGYTADSFRRFPHIRARTELLPNPLLDPPRGGAEPREGSFTVGYVGQLEPRKRAPDVVRALAHLPEEVCAVFVGDGKRRSELEAVVQASAARDRVEILGYRSDVVEQMARFHCLAAPSVREPFGLVGLEAMALGVPVIAARSGAWPEVLGDAALYHEPCDSRDIARQVRRLRDDAALREELRARGFARVARFDAASWTESVEKILRQVVRPRRPVCARSDATQPLRGPRP